MLPRCGVLRSGALATLAALLTAAIGVALVEPSGAQSADRSRATSTAAAAHHVDPRKTRGLFVDPKMPAANHGQPYAKKIGSHAQALWIIPEAYPTSQVRGIVRAYTSRALAAKKTPMLSVYGIPGRDCGGQSSSGALQNAASYRAWIRQIAQGLEKQKALVILEPDALPLFSSNAAACPTKPAGWAGMLRYAGKTLSKSGAWVYLDAGHSDWTPYDTRPAVLKSAGIQYDRGFSTNVSNFRPTSDEQTYAKFLLAGLRKLGVHGKHYVIDTSRNGNPNPVDGDVLNPTWARIGKAPQLRFDGAFDGTLWVKHPGESDGYVNGGNASGQWCSMLADKLLTGSSSQGC